MIADSISSGKSSDATPGETVGDVGNRHLADLRGDWKVDVWVLDEDGGKIQAEGRAKGIAAGDHGTRILYNDIKLEADKNVYDFFLTGTAEPEMITPGMIRSMLRVEIRVSSPAMWVAEAYTHIDGKEVQVQSYRFTRS